MNEIIQEILSVLSLEAESIVKKKHGQRPEVLAYRLVEVLLTVRKSADRAEALGLSTRTFDRMMPTVFEGFNPPSKALGWSNYLLSLIGKKTCSKCIGILPIDQFIYSNINTSLNLSSICRSCNSTKSIEYRAANTERCREYGRKHFQENKGYYRDKNARYRTIRSQATPRWSEREAIIDMYSNCPEGYHVDHIYPLQGKTVCGLHVLGNLQYLIAEENLRKSNKVDCLNG